MKKTLLKFLAAVLVTASITSCNSTFRNLREPNTTVKLTKSDFTLSDQVVGEAKTVKVLGIDWKRIFKQQTGSVNGNNLTGFMSLAYIPVLGPVTLLDKTVSYSLYNLMEANPGYDVIFYPQITKQVKKPILGLGFLLKVTKVKTTARLGKLNK